MYFLCLISAYCISYTLVNRLFELISLCIAMGGMRKREHSTQHPHLSRKESMYAKCFTLAVFGPAEMPVSLQSPFPRPPASTCDLEKMV